MISARTGLALLAAILSWTFAAAQGQSKDPLVVVAPNGNYGYIDHAGKMVIPPIFIWGDGFDHGFANVYICGRHVWINAAGNVVRQRPVPSGELRAKRVGPNVGFLDSSGEWKIQPIYEDALPFSDGAAAVERNGRWGFIDGTGREFIPTSFQSAYYFHDDVGIVETSHGYALISKAGSVLATGYEFLQGSPAEGLVPAQRDGKSGYLDLHGRVAIPFEYDFAGTFHDGLAAVRKAGKYGYIGRGGQVRIPSQFDEAGEFSNGLAAVKIGSDSGFINESGEFAFRLRFENASGFQFDDGVSRFWTEPNGFGYVDTAGRIIWGPNASPPDHAPILGWSKEDDVESCDGIPESMRRAVAALPRED